MSIYHHLIVVTLLSFSFEKSFSFSFNCTEKAPTGYNTLVTFTVSGSKRYACMHPGTKQGSGRNAYASIYQISPTTGKLAERLSVYMDSINVVNLTKRTREKSRSKDSYDDGSEEELPWDEDKPVAAQQPISSTDISTLESNYENNCNRKKKFTAACCSNTEQCLKSTDYDNDDASLLSKMGQTYYNFQKLAQTADMTMTASGINKGCKTIKTLNTLGAVVNTSLSRVCYNSRFKCQNSCDAVISNAQGYLSTFGINITGTRVGRSSCNNIKSVDEKSKNESINLCQRVVKVYSDAYSKLRYCNEGTSGRPMVLVSQSLMLGAMADKFRQCEVEIKSKTASYEGGQETSPSGDCASLANASNPICIRCNANPKAKGCENITTIGANNNSYRKPTLNQSILPNDIDLSGDGSVGYDSNMIDDNDYELGSLEDIEAKGSGVNPIASNGSGGPSGGSGSVGVVGSNSNSGSSTYNNLNCNGSDLIGQLPL